MARRPASAPLVGREEELTDLLGAIESVDPDRPVVLIAGEAGIGKTRLVNEVVRRLEGAPAADHSSQWLVARGSCLRLAEGELPFAPILEILDAIPERHLVDQLRARLAGAGDSAPAVGSAEARAMRFVDIRDVLVAASHGAPFLLVIDDLHWADQSTLDLVLFLARRLRGHSVVLLGAYRSDELHRRHPLRPVVAELSRGYVRERIELGPLAREAAEEQVRQLRDSMDSGLVREVVARADGNPFYVEELVALDSDRSPLPASVRDVLLARLAALDEASIRVLGACAVVGREVDLPLLQQVIDLDPAAMAASISTAVDHSILIPTAGSGYRFRHALLEEAVHDDLLPADRVELHRRVAAALQLIAATPGAVVPPGELARHLDLSGDRAGAVEAYLEAAARAFRALAWAEGVAAFERAAELVATVGLESGVQSSRRLKELVVPAALAMNWSGSPGRSIALLREWSARTEANGDHTTAALLWMTLSQILNEVGDEPGSREAGAAAVRLYKPTESTALGISLLIDLAAGRWIANRQREAFDLSERAVSGAERLTDPALLFRALLERGAALITLGQLERGLADVERARALQVTHGHMDTFGHLTTNIPAALAEVGLLAPALELTREGLRVSRELGIEHSWEPWILPGLAAHAYFTGQWADADGPIAATRAYQPGGLAKHYLEMFAALLAAGRGDLDACDAAILAAEEAGVGLIGAYGGFRGEARAARAEAAGDAAGWLAEAEAAGALLEATDSFVARSRLAVATASASADLVEATHPSRDRERVERAREKAQAGAELAAAIDRGTTVPGTASVPWTRANAALAAAEAARAAGDDDPAAWPPVADAFRAMGMLPRVAYVLYRAAAAEFAAGDRMGGTPLLLEARDLASSIGMAVLRRRIDALARAARVDVAKSSTTEMAPSPRPERNPWGLSARELEVLALLADGRTNGEIGARLFISTKTASVHVTHILDKLGVSTRTEAALLASRAGLLEGHLQRAE